MPRFVLLYHDCPDNRPRPSHWDFLLEEDEKLRAWALAREPVPNADLTGEQLADHRLEYLQYEGPVSAGRGSVSRWDAGSYELLEDEPTRVVVQIEGARAAGRWELTRSDTAAQRWRVMWSRS